MAHADELLGLAIAAGQLAAAGALPPPTISSVYDAFSATNAGLVPASGGGMANLLRADGAWTNAITGLLNLNLAGAGTALQIGGFNVAGFDGGVNLIMGGLTAAQWASTKLFAGGRDVLDMSNSGNVTINTPTSGQTLTLAPSPAAGELIATSAALTTGAGAAAGTITNAPSAGNPTKWIKINDAGTIRSIPAW